MNNWIKAIVLGCIILLIQNVDVDVCAQMNGGYGYANVSEEADDDVSYGAWMLQRYNGKFTGNGIVLSLYLVGEEFRGELSANGRIYQVGGLANDGWVNCEARNDDNEESLIFRVQYTENGLKYEQTGKSSILLKQIPFPEVEGVYQGKNLLLGIKKDVHGKYSGVIMFGNNKLERFLNENLGLNEKRFFTAEEKGGRISGEYSKINGKKKVGFAIEYEEPEQLYYVEDGYRTKLDVSGPTEHLMKARAAKARGDLDGVISEARKVLSSGEYHLREAQELLNEANQDATIADVIQQRLKKAKKYASKAVTREDWLKVKEEAEEALKLAPRNESAEELRKQAERELRTISERAEEVEEYLDEARTAKRRENWSEVIRYADKVLNDLDKNNAEAKELKSDAEREQVKQAQEEKINGYLKDARRAKERGDWKTVKSKAEAVLKLESNHYEARRLKNEAEEELKPKVRIGENITIQLGGGVKLDMIGIREGSFVMGSPIDEDDRGNDEKQHNVSISKGFWLGKYEVTQGQYRAIMGNNPAKSYGVGDNCPVYNVSWDDAMDFCRKLTEKERAAGRLPSGYKYTLPTEAQWEYACRAGTKTSLNSGSNIITWMNYCPNIDKVAWYTMNTGTVLAVRPVGQKQPNAWGLYDMHGNVWEWCLDWKGDYPTSSITDPTGPSTGTNRVIRGGAWDIPAKHCRSATRISCYPAGRFANLGFRLALVPVQ